MHIDNKENFLKYLIEIIIKSLENLLLINFDLEYQKILGYKLSILESLSIYHM